MQEQKSRVIGKMTFYYLVSTALKGISQVILIENAISGLIILSAITMVNYQSGIVALVSGIIGTLIGYAGGADEKLVDQGLFGYNSVLIGLALSFLLNGSMRWGIAFVGAAFAAILTAAMMHFLKKLEIPVLTFPYILLTWLFLLVSYHLQVFKLTPQLVPQILSQWSIRIEGNVEFLDGLVDGIGQVFFQNNAWVAVSIIVAVFWDNRKLGIYTILGAIIGWFTAYALGAEYTLLNVGIYGYNAVLTILAISQVFDADSLFAPITGVIAAMITVPITASIDTLLMPYGLPVFTMPFVLVTWIFIGARKVLPKL